MSLWTLLMKWLGSEESVAPPSNPDLRWEWIALRRNDPPPTYDNTNPKDLQFWGKVLLHVESVWNGPETKGTHLDGEIVDRLAIYERRSGGFVSEHLRYNPRAIFVGIDRQEPIPMLSIATEWDRFEDAVGDILAQPVMADTKTRKLFHEELRRHERAEPTPGTPTATITKRK